MPIAFDSGSNTRMLLDVAGSVLERRPVERLTLPAFPPDAFAIMQCDGDGNVSWLTQYVSALAPDPSYNYFFAGVLDPSGAGSFGPDRPLVLRPYGKRVVYAVHLICRMFDANRAAAVYAQGAVTFDPAASVAEQWTADIGDVCGDCEDFRASLQTTRVLPPGVSITLSITCPSFANDACHVDAILYYPIDIPK